MKSFHRVFVGFVLITGLLPQTGKSADLTSTLDGAAAGDSQRALLSAIEQELPANVRRQQDGSVSFVELPFRFVTDETLAMLSRMRSLRELRLRFSSKNNQLTSRGISDLGRLPHLENLALMCPRSLHAGLLSAVAKLQALTSLTLNRADSSPLEYSSLTNMVQLQELTIIEAPNFGDKEVLYVLGLPNLRRLVLAETSVTDAWLTVARSSRSLTNVIVSPRRGSEVVEWSRMDLLPPVGTKDGGPGAR
jgi:hypothetical protein